MNEHLQPILLNVNAVVCAVTAIRLFWWRQIHRPAHLQQQIALYLLIVACAAVTIRTLTGEYYFSDWSEAVINVALCFFCLTRPDTLFNNREKHEN